MHTNVICGYVTCVDIFKYGTYMMCMLYVMHVTYMHVYCVFAYGIIGERFIFILLDNIKCLYLEE